MGTCSRAEAESLLTSNGIPGASIIRKSARASGGAVISMLCDINQPKHFQIQRGDNQKFYIATGSSAIQSFDSKDALIAYYTKENTLGQHNIHLIDVPEQFRLPQSG